MENLNKFLSKESYRLWMTEIQSENGYLYATDSSTMIRKKGDAIPTKYECNAKFEELMLDTIIDEFPINRENLIKLINDIPTEDVFDDEEIERYHCDGSGEIECDCCGHETDCDECNGEGFEFKKGTKVINKKFTKDVKFDNKLVNPKFLNRLLEVDGDIIYQRINGTKLRFKIDEYDILIMGLTCSDDYLEFKI